MPLVQEPTEIVTDPRGYLTAVHGDASVGKTSFCQQIPGHYFLYGANAGIEGLSVYGDPITSWGNFIDKAKELLAAKTSKFKDQRPITTIIVDVLTDLFDYAAVEVCKTQRFLEKGVAKKYDKIEDVPFGKGYKATCKLMLRNLGILQLHGFGIVMTSHTKERIFKWAGADHTHFGFNLPPSAELAVKAACGAIGHFVTEEEIKRNEDGDIIKAEVARVMYWQPTFTRLAKHRLEGFPEKLPLPMNKGWETYCAAFTETVEKIKEAKLRKTEISQA
jgi:hypothetical protein